MFLEMGDGRGRRRWMIYVSREGRQGFKHVDRKWKHLYTFLRDSLPIFKFKIACYSSPKKLIHLFILAF